MPPESDKLARRIEEDRRHRLRLALAVGQCADLLPLLDAAAYTVVGGKYRLDSLLAMGSQFFVWSATQLDSRRTAILKQARFDYRHPVRYGRADVARLRAAVRREGEVLRADTSGTLPGVLDLLVADSPVPAAAASPALAKDEVFVVEEHVRGLTLTELALRVWPGQPAAEREAAVARLAGGFVTFWTALRGANWFYGDLSADNMLMEASGRLRVVDAGSAVPAGEQVVLTGFTPAYTAPRLFEATKQRKPVPGTIATVLPSFAKVLHFVLTGREQLNGALPDLHEPKLWDYTPLCRMVLEGLTAVEAKPERAADVLDTLARWAQASGE